jgi:hypothetical protein
MTVCLFLTLLALANPFYFRLPVGTFLLPSLYQYSVPPQGIFTFSCLIARFNPFTFFRLRHLLFVLAHSNYVR